ncbi:MAG: translation elongation factor Ts [Proteobacteria bacterium]|nr:translation elongation factor Ts [Pseudomonadota bacterium]
MAQIRELRERTGAGILDCKNALVESDGDIEKAVDWLRTKGIAKAAKKAGRTATEGLIGSYIHAGGKIGVLLEINCETDFAARGEAFQALVKDISMHIAASAPEYVAREEVSAEAIAHERAVQKARVIEEGKPEKFADGIVEGRMRKYYEDVCLLEQKFVRDDSKTVKDVLTDAIALIGENIQIRRFTRYVLGEGLAKKEDDFAAEVAAAAGQ